MSVLQAIIQAATMSLTSVALTDYLRRKREAQEKVGSTMTWDIVGASDLDDLAGVVGADFEALIGDDPDTALLQALAVSGLGNTDIIGAAAATPAARARQAAAVKAAAAKNAAAVVSRGMDRRRRCPLGFLPTNVAASGTQLIPGSPQNLFRVEGIVVPSDICFDFGVTDLKVGNQSQFVQSVEVPAAVFSEVAIHTAVMFDTAEVGNQVSIQVRNKDAVNAIQFTAAALGTIAK